MTISSYSVDNLVLPHALHVHLDSLISASPSLCQTVPCPQTELLLKKMKTLYSFEKNNTQLFE